MSSLKVEALRANRPGRFTVLGPQARWIYPRAFITTPYPNNERHDGRRHWNNHRCADCGANMARNGTVENADTPVHKPVYAIP